MVLLFVGDQMRLTYTVRLPWLKQLSHACVYQIQEAFIELGCPFRFKWAVDTLPPGQNSLLDTHICEEINHS